MLGTPKSSGAISQSSARLSGDSDPVSGSLGGDSDSVSGDSTDSSPCCVQIEYAWDTGSGIVYICDQMVYSRLVDDDGDKYRHDGVYNLVELIRYDRYPPVGVDVNKWYFLQGAVHTLFSVEECPHGIITVEGVEYTFGECVGCGCCNDPVTIEGTAYPLDYQDGHMTQGVITEIYGSGIVYEDVSDPDSPWSGIILPVGDLAGQGEISFGVSCANSVEISFAADDTSTSPDFEIIIYVHLNGNVPVPFSLTYAAATDNYTVDLSGEAECGNVVTIVAVASRTEIDSSDGILTLTATVTAIT